MRPVTEVIVCSNKVAFMVDNIPGVFPESIANVIEHTNQQLDELLLFEQIVGNIVIPIDSFFDMSTGLTVYIFPI